MGRIDFATALGVQGVAGGMMGDSGRAIPLIRETHDILVGTRVDKVLSELRLSSSC